MKTLRMLPVLLSLLFLPQVAEAGEPVDGKWALTVTLESGQGGQATLDLVEKEGKITGKYSGALGELDVTGTADGNKIEVAVESEAGKVTYSGEIAKDGTMKGTCNYGQLGAGTFEGKKQGEAS
jgi:hypothetical protein